MNLRKKLFTTFEKTINTKARWFNWKLGLMGGTFSGSITYFFNDSHGFLDGIQGGANQFFYNFMMGGVNSKICENIVNRIENKYLSIGISTVVPTTISFVTNYLWHKFLGTAEPMDSSTWQIPLNAVSFFGFGYYWKNQKR